jgi:hypothetical protein
MVMAQTLEVQVGREPLRRPARDGRNRKMLPRRREGREVARRNFELKLFGLRAQPALGAFAVIFTVICISAINVNGRKTAGSL